MTNSDLKYGFCTKKGKIPTSSLTYWTILGRILYACVYIWIKKVRMYILLRYPKIVESYSPYFEDLFSPSGYGYFRRYLSGLLVSENKTIEAINRLFVLEKRNQSSFNRFVNRQNFDIDTLHARRLSLLQSKDKTQFKTDN